MLAAALDRLRPWYDSQYADPNDIDSGVGASHGESRCKPPGSA